MNLSYTVEGLLRDEVTGEVTVTLKQINGPGRVTVVLASGNAAIAQLTIGRQINAVFTAV